MAVIAGFRRTAVRADARMQAPEIVVKPAPGEVKAIGFDRKAFGIVGVYDVDWLTHPGFERLLDNLAASPDGFHGVRFFGAFTAGQAELLAPEGGGVVWPSVDAP